MLIGPTESLVICWSDELYLYSINERFNAGFKLWEQALPCLAVWLCPALAFKRKGKQTVL